jgi:hypothetical protein
VPLPCSAIGSSSKMEHYFKESRSKRDSFIFGVTHDTCPSQNLSIVSHNLIVRRFFCASVEKRRSA